MLNRPTHSEIIDSMRDVLRQLARAHGEIDRSIVISRDMLTQSRELLAKVDDVLARRTS